MSSQFREYELVSRSGLFDPAFYAAQSRAVSRTGIDPLLHYLEIGWKEGLEPHADFDSRWYVAQCRKRRLAIGNPLVHFLTAGRDLGLTTRRERAHGKRARAAAPTDSTAASIEALEGGQLRVRVPKGATQPWQLRIDQRLVVELDPSEFSSSGEEASGTFTCPVEKFAQLIRGVDSLFSLADGQPHSVELLAGSTLLRRATLKVGQRVTGHLSLCDGKVASGWAAAPGENLPPASVDLYINGIRYHTALAALRHSDSASGNKADNGFLFKLPRSSSLSGLLTIAAKAGHGTAQLAGSPRGIPAPPAQARDGAALLAGLLQAQSSQITVVVPVFNATKEVEHCIESLVKHNTLAAKLLVIDDASTDPGIRKLLRKWDGKKGITVHSNRKNLGYTRTVNLGIRLAGRNDVVLLNSDTEVPARWLEGLRSAAYSSPFVGTATALSNNAGAFSVPEPHVANSLPAGLDITDYSRLARQASLNLYPRTPTGHGFCMYVRRNCLDAVGEMDEKAFPRGYGEENDFCMRASRAGFAHVMDDRTVVYHRRSASFGAEKTHLLKAGQDKLTERYPEYQHAVGTFLDDPDTLTAQWRIRGAVQAYQASGIKPKPRVLFVISTSTGGTPATNRDLMEALADRYKPWLLRCDSSVLELSRLEGGQLMPVETRELRRPILPADHRSPEYEAHIADLVTRHGIELVHIRHIAWHSLGLPATCKALGVPVVFSFHDFYTVCPTVKLLDENNVHCKGRCTATQGDCKPDLWNQGDVPPLKHRFIHRWQEMIWKAIEVCDAFVTTSPSAQKLLTDIYPGLRKKDFRLIPHGRSFAKMSRLASFPKRGEPLRILVPGNISVAKGAALIEAISGIGKENELELHVLGDSGHIPARANIILHGKYDREDFADRVAQIRPHIGAVLSLWPETYCHTLTEMWACGLPVLGLDIGAVGDRIKATEAGWLVSARSSPESILNTLRELRRNHKRFKSATAAVISWQASAPENESTRVMARAYDQLYQRRVTEPVGETAEYRFDLG